MTGSTGDGAQLHTTVHTDGDRTTFTLTGELDLVSGPALTLLLDTAMHGSVVQHLDVQMAQVDFVDVYGVRALVHAYQRGAARGITLTLQNLQPNIALLLHLTGAALLLGDSTAPDDAAMLCPGHPPPPVKTPGEPMNTPCVPLTGTTSERDRRADERDRRADEREQYADDRDLLSHERDRLINERQQRVSEHQRWEDIREDVINAREHDLAHREKDC